MGSAPSPLSAEAVAARLLGRIRAGRIEVLQGSRRLGFGPSDARRRVEVRVHHPAFWRSLFRGSAGLAEAYAEGLWDCDDLVALFRIGALEAPRLDGLARRFSTLVGPARLAAAGVRRNNRVRSRANVAAHYDLGNDFFALFLDETMTYSCAVFDPPGIGLREAQETKLDKVCRKLELDASDHLLEIGTGWGSLAIWAASHHGCRVTSVTLSGEQRAAAMERVRAAGLSDRVEVLLQDYRDIRDSYDKLVSIEMIEAVGWQYFDRYFERCSELVRHDGAMLLQAITIDDRAYEVEKASRTFINKHVFPGGCLPSQEVIARCLARRTDLSTIGLEDLTPHYVETLRVWRQRLRAAGASAAELGFERPQRRMWDLYLAYCEAGFAERRIADVQLLLAKPGFRPSRPPATHVSTNGAGRGRFERGELAGAR